MEAHGPPIAGPWLPRGSRERAGDIPKAPLSVFGLGSKLGRETQRNLPLPRRKVSFCALLTPARPPPVALHALSQGSPLPPRAGACRPRTDRRSEGGSERRSDRADTARL